MDSVIVAVSHDSYVNLKVSDFKKILHSKGSIMDVKSIFKIGFFSTTTFLHWRL